MIGEIIGGHYKITAKLGEGGMGAVYRATDTRLEREVAIKFSNAQFNERFEREAKVIASLNHPNICQLYDVGPNYLVMELVEGESPKGPLPLETALEYARQIADALEAAHEKGIIHRDLKPDNVKVKEDGTVKVLDFGLAKLVEVSSGDSKDAPTVSMGATQVGAILGTPAYMSPEQARGKTVDKRTDIWAFGVVLFEMLTGSQPFGGETLADRFVSVVKEDPKWEQAPFEVRRLLQRCLAKDPKRRLRDIGDAMGLVEEARPAPEPIVLPAPPAPEPKLAPLKIAWAVAAVCFIAAAVLAFTHFREAAPVAEPVRFQAALPENVNFTLVGVFAVSPDGRKVAFNASGADGVPRLFVRALDSLIAQPLAGTETGPRMIPLFWSPDSRFLVFQADGKLKKIDTTGGPPQPLCDAPTNVFGGAWNRDDVIIFSLGPGLMKIPAAGGTATPVTTLNASRGENAHGFPEFLPDQRHFLYMKGSPKPEYSGAYVGSLDAKPEQQSDQRLIPADSQVAYAAEHLLFIREGTLFAQSFDAKSFKLAGEPVPVADQVGYANGMGFFSASANGVLAYRTGGTLATYLQLTWFNRQGQVVSTPGEPGRYGNVKISPDGKRAAVVRTDPQTSNADIWLIDLVSGAGTRFTFDPATDGLPVWSPDGSHILWESNRGGSWGVYQKASNGSGNDELLYKNNSSWTLTDWSHDGRFIIFNWPGLKETKSDLFALPVGPGTSSDRKPFPLVQTPASELGGYLSPDGRWIAYISDESGRSEIYVQAFNPTAGTGTASLSGKWMVSKGSLGMARWRADSKELVFIGADGGLMSVDVTANPVFQASPPKLLFQLPRLLLGLTQTPGSITDATRDLQKFLVALPAKQSEHQELTVVLNWQSGLKK